MKRRSSVCEYLPQEAEWREIHSMSALWATNQDQKASHLGLCDRSCLTRFGVKGPGAVDWLSQHLSLPGTANTWQHLPEGGLVARLGMTEFLVEDTINSAIASYLTRSLTERPVNVYPVLRQDLAIALTGEAVPDLLRQTCSFNFSALRLSESPVILTSMIGVGVVVIPSDRHGLPYYRIWCDGTFGPYLWHTLAGIVEELGGGIIGLSAISDCS